MVHAVTGDAARADRLRFLGRAASLTAVVNRATMCLGPTGFHPHASVRTGLRALLAVTNESIQIQIQECVIVDYLHCRLSRNGAECLVAHQRGGKKDWPSHRGLA